MRLTDILLWSGIGLGAVGGMLQLRDFRGELRRLYEPPGDSLWKPALRLLVHELHATPKTNAFGCYIVVPEIFRRSR